MNEHLRKVVDARRRLILQGLAALPLGLSFRPALAAASPCELSFRHLHTDEKLRIVFRNAAGYVPAALKRINHLLRDFRTGEVASIDPRLLDILHALHTKCGGETFEIISGYRSAATNASLRKAGGRASGVAVRSLHMDGRAIDVRLTGFDTGRLRNAAVALAAGGVGYYPESDFVHLDTGRVRTWGATA